MKKIVGLLLYPSISWSIYQDDISVPVSARLCAGLNSVPWAPGVTAQAGRQTHKFWVLMGFIGGQKPFCQKHTGLRQESFMEEVTFVPM